MNSCSASVPSASSWSVQSMILWTMSTPGSSPGSQARTELGERVGDPAEFLQMRGELAVVVARAG